MENAILHVLNIEKNSFQAMFENDSFVASLLTFSIWIPNILVFPKKHLNKLSELSDQENN
jgi:galactose-1-phosphate uridylyltransferase